MDLETENRIASILLKEAAELRRRAEKEGVLAYLRKSNVRGRPNSRFLTATVLGIQQANRSVEVKEMWRVRQKELELDDRLKQRSSSENSHKEGEPPRHTTRRQDLNDEESKVACSSRKAMEDDSYSSEDEGLRDEEVDEFLQSRVKRGRGSIGSRMDETGPYLPRSTDSKDRVRTSFGDIGKVRQHQVVHGPEKPLSCNALHSSEDEDETKLRKSKRKRSKLGSSKEHSGKHKPKEKSRDKKKSRKEERRHRHRH